KRAYCLKTQPATGETYPKSDLFNKAHAGLNKPPILARLTRSLQRRNAKIENRLDDFHRFPNNECVLTHNQVIS
ncbi:hypothetical protein ABEK52_26390, partial [Klebsiella pneumoniae]